uniref:Uncharacterized protein n=1 Tax=Anguilla anguilla TaxID=7936 RepID=A0A0E9W5I6_ANGAN
MHSLRFSQRHLYNTAKENSYSPYLSRF